MNDIVDIVIPWLNPTEKWYSEYKKYCENENPARIRDLNTMRPAIRSILKNLPWIRYIWLIVYDEEQIPDWEELKNEKIKFVFHRDIIPQEFLPTFNGIFIASFVQNISELSENFIWSNDDIIFGNYIPKEFFFKDNKSVHRFFSCEKTWKNVYVNTYAEIMNSTSDFIEKISNKKVFADDHHIAIPIKKSICEFIYLKYRDDIINSFANSKVRLPTNISMTGAAFTLEEIFNKCCYDLFNDIKIQVIHLDDKTTDHQIEQACKYDIFCINDSEGLKNNATHIADFLKTIL